MRKYHNTLLTTAAALALIVSAGVASAQEPSKSESPGAGAPRAAQNNPMGQHPGGAPSPSAGEQRPASAAQQQPSSNPSTAQQQQQRPGGTSMQRQPNNPATAQEHERRNGTSVQEQQRRGGMNAQQRTPNTPATAEKQGHGTNTAQGRNGLNGLQGNASGTNVQLSQQQRTDLRQSVIEAHGAPRVGHVDFDVTVGTAVPRDRIHLVPVPDTLVRIEPSWHGYLYFVYTDEIIVVNPNDMRIVGVLMV